ncbi:MAG: hypothetical protein KAW88_04290 [Candidatus Cloacimonetes bacterium]|nr:hypothetical protein [Candidatus Cloacimonadota bacterium]
MAKRIGEILHEKGYLTLEQVEEALLIQKQYSNKGMWMYIGQILIEKGIVTKEQVNEGLDILERAKVKT